MGWFFRDRPQFPKGVPAPDWPPAEPEVPINEDWRAGDLAKCVSEFGTDGHAIFLRHNPRKGDILRVTEVFRGRRSDGLIGIGLRFEGKPQHLGWCCTGFRKLRPAIEAAEDEFVAELRNRLSAPAPEGSPA